MPRLSQVCEVLAALLDTTMDAVSIFDDFFSIGLRSNTAVSLSVRINKRLPPSGTRRRLEPAQVFERRTVAELAALVPSRYARPQALGPGLLDNHGEFRRQVASKRGKG